MLSQQELDVMNADLHALTNAVSVNIDDFPIDGITSWVALKINSESDIEVNLIRTDDGAVLVYEGYGAQFALEAGVSNFVLTENNFLHALTDCEDFNLRCTDFYCDNWGDEDCAAHSDKVAGIAAWNLINYEVLSVFLR